MFRSYRWMEWPSTCSRETTQLVSTALVFLIGLIDYSLGWQISLSVVYVYPIAIAAWHVGSRFAYLLSLLSVILFTVGDLAAGFSFGNWLVPVWNAAIRIAFYAILIELLAYIRSLTIGLELRVLQRTADLQKEITARERLEQELLEVGERERRRLGFDLHDGLCQHLTGTALAVQVLKEKLARRGWAEAAEAAKAVDLIEDGIAMSRKMAKGLQPVEMHSGGLMQALQEFSATTTDLFKLSCRFECEAPILFGDVATADHLYHIAREATSNAVKHGHARHIVISLDARDDGTFLTIIDDGIGIPNPAPRKGGMGLTIMAQRAKLIRGTFDIKANAAGGTIVTCCLPHPAHALHPFDSISRSHPSYV